MAQTLSSQNMLDFFRDLYGALSGLPRPSVRTTLPPSEQAALERWREFRDMIQKWTSGQAGKLMGQRYRPLPGLPRLEPIDAFRIMREELGELGRPGAPGRAREIEEAVYGMERERLDPQFAESEEKIRTRLVNQGVVPGSEAWNREMNRFGEERAGAYRQARRQATVGGAEEYQRQFARGLSRLGARTGLEQSEQNRRLKQHQLALGRYGMMEGRMPARLQQLMQLFGSVQPPGAPPGMRTPMFQMQSPNILGGYGLQQQGYQNQLAQYQAALSQSGGMTSDIFSIVIPLVSALLAPVTGGASLIGGAAAGAANQYWA